MSTCTEWNVRERIYSSGFFFYLLLITKNINYAFFPDIKISVSNSGEVNLDLFLIFEFNPPPLFFFYITPDITISQTTYNILDMCTHEYAP